MNYKVQLKKNINKNYIYTLIQNIDLTRGIWMIYLASKGMSLTQMGLLETIFHITSFLIEVPTGAVADLFGRKAIRVLGRIMSFISVILLLVADNFNGLPYPSCLRHCPSIWSPERGMRFYMIY